MNLNMKCSNCIYYSKVYIHPWSKLEESQKGFGKAFACMLFMDKEFMKDDPDTFVDVMVGKLDSCGCECYTEKE